MEEMYTYMKWGKAKGLILSVMGKGVIWKSFLDEWRSVIASVFLRLEIKDQTNPKQNHKEILT